MNVCSRELLLDTNTKYTYAHHASHSFTFLILFLLFAWSEENRIEWRRTPSQERREEREKTKNRCCCLLKTCVTHDYWITIRCQRILSSRMWVCVCMCSGNCLLIKFYSIQRFVGFVSITTMDSRNFPKCILITRTSKVEEQERPKERITRYLVRHHIFCVSLSLFFKPPVLSSFMRCDDLGVTMLARSEIHREKKSTHININ